MRSEKWEVMKNFLIFLFFTSCFLLLTSHFCLALSDEEILTFQSAVKDLPAGERIAFWAEKFVGTPYDKDPLGEYVSKAVIIADERVDCMYLTFRAVELALSSTGEEAVQTALDKRFHTKGVIKNSKVINYDDRFMYGEDMIESGKWGSDITGEIGSVIKIKGSGGRDHVDILPPEQLLKAMDHLKSGDIIFLIRGPDKRVSGEIVGHIGIIKTEGRTENATKKTIAYLIHASGVKGKGGAVKKVLLKDYIKRMPFKGAKITRFN